MPIKVYQNDKGDLRKAVMRAQNNFPNLGITYNGSSFNSYFYSGTEFTTFCTNYERAYKELVKLDGRFYSSKTIAAIANELNSAIDNLIAGKSLKTNCTAREYNLGLEKLGNGNYKIIEIDGGEQYEITYDARDNVYFTPDTYEGYTYVGKCALTNESIAPSDYYGKTLASLPAFFTSSNTTRQKMELQGGVSVFTDGAETITVPRFDGDTTAYEWVAAVDDTSLTMVNFYFIDQNKIYFDPNDGSSGVNLLTQPTTYKSENNFYSPTFTSSPGNGVTATFDQTDSTFTFNGTPTTGAEYFRFPIAGKLKANTNYTYRVVYVSGSKTLDGGTLTLHLISATRTVTDATRQAVKTTATDLFSTKPQTRQQRQGRLLPMRTRRQMRNLFKCLPTARATARSDTITIRLRLSLLRAVRKIKPILRMQFNSSTVAASAQCLCPFVITTVSSAGSQLRTAATV